MNSREALTGQLYSRLGFCIGLSEELSAALGRTVIVSREGSPRRREVPTRREDLEKVARSFHIP